MTTDGFLQQLRAEFAGEAFQLDAWVHGPGLPSNAPQIEIVEISDGWSEQLGDLEVRAGALPGGPIDAFAYRFEARGRSAWRSRPREARQARDGRRGGGRRGSVRRNGLGRREEAQGFDPRCEWLCAAALRPAGASVAEGSFRGIAA